MAQQDVVAAVVWVAVRVVVASVVEGEEGRMGDGSRHCAEKNVKSVGQELSSSYFARKCVLAWGRPAKFAVAASSDRNGK